MNFKALAILATLSIGQTVFATDLILQKQCEALPAVSCKVIDINVDTFLSSAPMYALTVKYCRNRVFKVRNWKLSEPKVVGGGVLTSNWCTEAVNFAEVGSTLGVTPHTID